jgi:DeoR/GlpR family transcriptional regulator of sugar metabolism
MARHAGVSDRTIRRALKRLEIAGLLKAVYRGGFRRGLTKYRVRPLKTDGA